MHKFPFYLQHDSMQCGIACLQMICKYFGREYTIDSLSNLCFATAEGVSLLGINEAANTLGYYPVLQGKINIGNTDINKLNKKWWRRQCGVVIQDGVIFLESIARNIAVDDGDIDKKLFWKEMKRKTILSLAKANKSEL